MDRRKNTATPKIRRSSEMTLKQLCASVVKAFGSRTKPLTDAEQRRRYDSAPKWGDDALTEYGVRLQGAAFGVGFRGARVYALDAVSGRYAEVVV